jgi:hypothetical protein
MKSDPNVSLERIWMVIRLLGGALHPLLELHYEGSHEVTVMR